MTRKHWSGRKLNSTTHRLKPFAINKIPRSGGVLKENRGIKAKCQLAITELANIIFLMNVIIELFSARHVFLREWQTGIHLGLTDLICGPLSKHGDMWHISAHAFTETNMIHNLIACILLLFLPMQVIYVCIKPHNFFQLLHTGFFFWEIKKFEKSIEADVALSTSILAFYVTDSPLFAQKMCLEDRGRLQTSMIFYMFMLFVAWFVDISNRLTSTQLGSVGVIY